VYLSLLIFKGFSTKAADYGSAPFFNKRRDALKSPKKLAT